MPAPSKPAPSPPETPLLTLLRRQIAAEGPVSVAAFMDLALNHPEHGYYRTRDPFGAGGDFITAPEISQVFGELLGLWLATAWQEAGRPDPFVLAELGPGRGQLMADLLRATRKVPGFVEAADLHLVETSERLRDLQRARLQGHEIHWHEHLDTVPGGPLFLIANEVFDALPAHQLLRTEYGWAERQVICGDDGALVFTEGAPPADLLQCVVELDGVQPGEIAEVSPAREALACRIGERLRREGGIAAVIDYGGSPATATGDTLQAVRDHQPVDPLTAPGEVDLTTQIDFRRLGRAAAEGGADVFGPVPQGTFLRTLGIEIRMAALLSTAGKDQQRALREALFRLTDASAMGEVFKVLVFASPAGPPPPGFGAPSLRGTPPSP
ncbi:MAG: SAM-dependent methyltransferase [Alphaproteobacteria bacterium]